MLLLFIQSAAVVYSLLQHASRVAKPNKSTKSATARQGQTGAQSRAPHHADQQMMQGMQGKGTPQHTDLGKASISHESNTALRHVFSDKVFLTSQDYARQQFCHLHARLASSLFVACERMPSFLDPDSVQVLIDYTGWTPDGKMCPGRDGVVGFPRSPLSRGLIAAGLKNAWCGWTRSCRAGPKELRL